MLQRPCPVRQVSGFINESVFIHRYVFPYNRGYWSVRRDNAVMYGRPGVYYVCTRGSIIYKSPLMHRYCRIDDKVVVQLARYRRAKERWHRVPSATLLRIYFAGRLTESCYA